MAISPNVNAYMQQGQEDAPQGAEQLFVKQFTSQAYNNLRAKYPALLNFVVTFRVLSSDIDEGSAFGVFVVRYGKNVRHVPVVMSDGSVTSCEMVYDKEDDAFAPLLEDTVKDIVAANSYSDPSILTKDPRVDDTRGLFRQMMRPPASSNVVLSGERPGVADLPNGCKALLSRYLQEEEPALLGKIAQFYDVEELAFKLSRTPENMPKLAAECLPDFLRLDTLTREAAALLDDDERADMLAHGYVIRGEKTASLVLPESDGASAVETALNITTWPGIGEPEGSHVLRSGRDDALKAFPVERGFLVQSAANGLSLEPVLLAGREIIAADSYVTLGGSGDGRETTALVSNHDAHVPESWYARFPNIVSADNVMEKIRERGEGHVHLHFFAPSRSGRLFIDGDIFASGQCSDWRVMDENGDRVFYTERSHFNDNPTIRVTPSLKHGYILHGSSIILPEDTLFMLSHDLYDRPVSFIGSLDVLRRLMYGLGQHVTVTNDGVEWSVTDRGLGKTASFRTSVDVAEFLHEAYGVGAEQARDIMRSGRSVVFSKLAFGEDGAPMPQAPADDNAAQGGMPEQGMAEQAAPQGMTPQQSFDPATLANAAEIGDPELLDAGILASFAKYPDIKQLLVGYLPDFLMAQDRLGRILLLFSYQKKELEEFYGQEKYASIIAATRKIFTTVGELVNHLRTYVNMAR